MKVSKLDYICITLASLWRTGQDERDELGNLIISKETERQIQEIVELAKIRRGKLKHVGDKNNLGRRKKEVQSSDSLRLEFIGGATVTSLALKNKVCRKTITNRLREGGINIS